MVSLELEPELVLDDNQGRRPFEFDDLDSQPQPNFDDFPQVPIFYSISSLSVANLGPLQCDNPYSPFETLDVQLELDVAAIPQIIPEVMPSSLSVATLGPMHSDMDNHSEVYDTDLDDDNSSDTLVLLEDCEFPSYFSVRGSPLPRLFPSYGAYCLPVDGDEMKVRITSFHIWYTSCRL